MAKKLTRAVKSRAGLTLHGYWTAGPGHDADNPCYIVPAAEYERLTRKAAKRGRRGK